MIRIDEVSKSFGDVHALNNVTTSIQDQSIFGLVGTNGAGKSTLLRIMSGVIKQDKGCITIDGESVYENKNTKEKLCFLPDTPYYFPNATAKTMAQFYKSVYPNFDEVRFNEFISKFGLDINYKISRLSKGMKKQVTILLGICTNTKYLFCDETFDGLDPVMRQAVKSIFASEMLKRDFIPVIASHNLRELEDICDHIGLLHKGGILLTKDLDDMKLQIHKIHCVIEDDLLEEQLLDELDILKHEKKGALLTIVARGDQEFILQSIQEKHPLFVEMLPLSLEEIFISETEVVGYDIKSLIL